MKTKEEIEALKDYQNNGRFHPYTCCSFNGCVRSNENDWGVLIPTDTKWICPCGKYEQDYDGFEEKMIDINKIK